MGKTFKVSAEMLARQRNKAAVVMAGYIEYAKQIGCTVQGDEIGCTAKQAKLLHEWWQVNAEGPVS